MAHSPLHACLHVLSSLALFPRRRRRILTRRLLHSDHGRARSPAWLGTWRPGPLSPRSFNSCCIMGGVLSRLRGLFFARNLELVIVGLANSGKTTFANYIAHGAFIEEGPTVGLNVKVVRKGGTTIKCWDLVSEQRQRQAAATATSTTTTAATTTPAATTPAVAAAAARAVAAAAKVTTTDARPAQTSTIRDSCLALASPRSSSVLFLVCREVKRAIAANGDATRKAAT